MKFLDILVDKIICSIPPFDFRVIIKFAYPSVSKTDVTTFYLLPDEAIEISDSEKKVVTIITRKGFFIPYIIVEFPTLTPD